MIENSKQIASEVKSEIKQIVLFGLSYPSHDHSFKQSLALNTLS